MRALTLWRPWPWAIFHAPHVDMAKRIENRPWKPWPSIIGKRIVLHAGKAFDKGSVDFILDTALLEGDPRVLPAEASDEGLIGVVTVAGFVETAEDAALRAGQRQERWFFGPYGWVFEDIRRFERPIPIKGAQGLWVLPAWADREVDRALRANLYPGDLLPHLGRSERMHMATPTPKLTREEVERGDHTIEQILALLEERDALKAAFAERNEFTAKRVVGELEKHGVVMGDQFDAMKADRDRLREACEQAKADLCEIGSDCDCNDGCDRCGRVEEASERLVAALAESRRA